MSSSPGSGGRGRHPLDAPPLDISVGETVAQWPADDSAWGRDANAHQHDLGSAPDPTSRDREDRMPSGRLRRLVAGIVAVALATVASWVVITTANSPTATLLVPAGPRLNDAPRGPVASRWSVALPDDTAVVALDRTVVAMHPPSRTSGVGMLDDARLEVKGLDLVGGNLEWATTVATGTAVIVVSLRSGSARQVGGSPELSLRAGAAAPPPLQVRSVVALEAETGEILWQHDDSDQMVVSVRADDVAVVSEHTCQLLDVETGATVVTAESPCMPTTTGTGIVAGAMAGDGWEVRRATGASALPASSSIPLVDGEAVVITSDTSIALLRGSTETWRIRTADSTCPAITPLAGVGAIVTCAVSDGLVKHNGAVMDYTGKELVRSDSLRHLTVIMLGGQPTAIVWQRRPLRDTVRLIGLADATAGLVVAESEASTEVIRVAESAPVSRSGIVTVVGPPDARGLALLSWPELEPAWRVPLTGGVVENVQTTAVGVAVLQLNGDETTQLTGFS